jgi:hypothetical protein
MCTKWLHWRYSHASHLVYYSTAFELSEKCKSTSLHAVQMKNWWQTTSTEEKLDTQSHFEKGDQIVDICHTVRLAVGSIFTICDNADRITESAKSGTEVLYRNIYILYIQHIYSGTWLIGTCVIEKPG